MKKILLVSAIVLAIVGFSFTFFFPYLNSVADKDFPNEGDEPDLPAFLKDKFSKEEFMLRRAEYIGLKRGYDEEKPVDPQLRQTAIAKMERQQNRLAALPASPERNALLAGWTPIGPAPIPNGQVIGGSQLAVSGRTIAIAVHPTNPNIVYVGTAQGGLYRSTDGGTTWTPMLDNALSLAVNTVAIAPSQPETVFVGTGEAGFSGDGFFGVGIYRIDNASSASPIVTGPLNRNAANADVFTGRAIGKIVVHPTDPNIIFASSTAGVGGISGTQNNVLPNRGLFRSTNALAANPTFTQLTITGLANNRNILDIVIDPGNPNLLLCTEADSFNETVGGVYRTTDALAANPTFVRTFTAGTGTSASRTELALHRSGAGVVTVYAASAFNGGTVQRSTDGGATWTQQIDNNFCGGQCFYNIAVAVDPTNADRVYLGGTGTTTTFGFSTNGGTSFTNSQSGLHTDSHTIAVAPSLPSTVYFGSDGGIYKSTDSGANWTSLNNTQFSATQFMSIAVHPTDPNFTIGGTQDNGTEFYRPNATWTRADFGDGGYAVIDQNAPDTTNVRMYHTYFNNGTLQGYGTVSTTTSAMDNGWAFRGCNNVAGNGIPCGGAVLFYAPLEQGPGNPNTIYYGANILYRSNDTGLTHTPVSQNLTNPISAIGISPQNDNVRIVGQIDGGIWGTTTGATTLTDLDTGNIVPNGFVARAVIDPNNANTAYITLSAFGVVNIWRTTNLNSATPTWTAAAGFGGNTLPQVPVSAFLVDPTNSNTLYAGTDIGVFRSTDGGASWTPFGTGLPRVAVFDMAITANPNRRLRIATHGRGMFEINLNAVPRTQFDFDGDGRADISVFRPDAVNASGWYIQKSLNSAFSAFGWGLDIDKITPADYDGDGKTDVAVWRGQSDISDAAYFYIYQSQTNTVRAAQFGSPGDVPTTVGDWDGDGKDDLAVYRNGATTGAQSFFYYRPSNTPATSFITIFWGARDDKPVPGDYDGDGRIDAAVFRPSDGTWYILPSSGGFIAYTFGFPTDTLVPADYDGDGKTDIAVYRNGSWYIARSRDGFLGFQFGLSTDVPVPADYNGDGKTDAAVVRDGLWIISNSNQGISYTQWGHPTDKPIPNAYIPR